MSNFTKQEYLELCQRLLDEQYSSDDESDDTSAIAWIPAESEIKNKMTAVRNAQGFIDLTKMKKEKIKEAIQKCDNFRVHDFTIRINHYNDKSDSFSITLYEDKTKTPSGNPCKMTYPVLIEKDSRFNGRSWITYFKGSKYGGNIPTDTLIEIIRFLQIIKKLSAFI